MKKSTFCYARLTIRKMVAILLAVLMICVCCGALSEDSAIILCTLDGKTESYVFQGEGSRNLNISDR